MQSQQTLKQNFMHILTQVPLYISLKIICYLEADDIESIYLQTSPSLIRGLSLINQQSTINDQVISEQYNAQNNQKQIKYQSIQLQPQRKQKKIKIVRNNTLFNETQAISSLFSFTALINRHIKSTERSMYLGIYDLSTINEYQNGIVQNMIEDIDSRRQTLMKWVQIDKSIQNIYKQIQQILQQLANKTQGSPEQAQQFVQELKLIFNDPELPMPKLRKQGIATNCASTLQFYLVDSFHPANKLKKPSQAPFQIISPLISYSLIKQAKNQSLIQQNSNESFFRQTKTRIFSLTVQLIENYCQISSLWVSIQSGQLQGLFCFISRFTILRGILIGVQNLLGGIIRQEDKAHLKKQYWEHQCCNGFVDVGLQLWKQEVQKFKIKKIQTYIKILHYYTSKVLIKKIEQSTGSQDILEQIQHRWLVNALKLKRISITSTKHNLICKVLPKKELRHKDTTNQKINRSESFMSQTCLSELEQQFLQDEYCQQQILREFIEYYIDICVDQYSVNWCGHSNQLLDKQFTKIQEQILQYAKKYLIYFKQISIQAKNQIRNINSRQSSQVLNYLIGKFFQIWDIGIVKPRTLYKILVLAHKTIEECGQLQSKTQEQLEININQDRKQRYAGQFGMKIKENDQLLEYYNENVWKISRRRQK